MEVTLGREMELLNEELKKVKPGWYVRSNQSVPLEWELVGPDGLAHYCRDKFKQIVWLAFGREKGEAFLKEIGEWK